MTSVAAQQPGRRGLSDPRLLAGVAGGLASALLALWAFRGLPLGAGFFWLAPLPLFLAGLGFGRVALGLAVAAGSLALLLLASTDLALLVWAAAFGLPALLLVATGLKPGRIDPSLPLALLGLWPAATILAAALLLAGPDAGLEAALRRAVEIGLARMGMPAAEVIVGEIVRIKAAAIAFWLALALVANATAAQGFLARRDLALAPTPRWSAARVPAWYPAAPVLAAILWLAVPHEADLVPLSVMLALLVPLLLQGLGAVHGWTRGRPGRPILLGGFYLVLIVFSVPMAAVVVGFGLFDQFGRRAVPPPT